jgi:hypothetical protein
MSQDQNSKDHAEDVKESVLKVIGLDKTRRDKLKKVYGR